MLAHLGLLMAFQVVGEALVSAALMVPPIVHLLGLS
jgi:hypothetical protein